MAKKEKNIKRGDCLASIAFEEGFGVGGLITANPNLMQSRSPYMLFSGPSGGDVVVIPEKKPRRPSDQNSKKTKFTHQFILQNTHVLFKLHLSLLNETLKKREYEFHIDGKLCTPKKNGEELPAVANESNSIFLPGQKKENSYLPLREDIFMKKKTKRQGNQSRYCQKSK